MSKAKQGDMVKIHYQGKLENGEVFDDSREGQPLEFTLGGGDVMSGIENGVLGMEAGEAKTIEIPCEEAFGQRREELVVEIEKSQLPDSITPAIGQRLEMEQKDGEKLDLTIIGLTEDTVTFDANHPLAGHNLAFDMELIEII